MKRHAAGNAGSELDLLVQSSGKMLLLHKLLPKLKDEGHKVNLPCGKNTCKAVACTIRLLCQPVTEQIYNVCLL